MAPPNASPNISAPKENKYSKLILGIGSFIVIMTAVLIANIILSNQLVEYSADVNLAGRQRMLTQRTAKLVNMIQASTQSQNDTATLAAQNELRLTYKLFDQTLSAFTNGGDTIGADGESVITLRQVSTPELAAQLKEANDIWGRFGRNVQNLAFTPPSRLDPIDIDESVEMAASYNLQLLALMNKLTQGLDDQAQETAGTLKMLQAGALAAILANFVWIITSAFGSLRRTDAQLIQYSETLKTHNESLEATNTDLAATQTELNNSNENLQSAYDSLKKYSSEAEQRANELEKLSRDLNRLKEESDTIFTSVDHGLFLIDKKAIIGRQVSSSTYDIFETENLSDRSLIDLLRPLITEKDTRTLESFLQLQFNPKTSSKQLIKFNPLKKIEITLNWDGQGFINKHLGFNFERIVDNGEIVAILVTVTDVTETVALENQLKQANQDQERKTGLILDIIRSDSQELEIFLAQTDKALNKINDTLKEEGVGDKATDEVNNNSHLIETIYRTVHNIKGNASMLKLNSIVETAHQVEDKLSMLRKKQHVTGDEFLGALVELAYMRELLNDYEELTQSLLRDFVQPAPSASAAPLTTSEKLNNELVKFTNDISAELAKPVQLQADLNVDSLGDNELAVNKDIIIQLIRNSLSHGFEDADTRKQLGKWERGSILLSNSIDNSSDNALGQPAHVFKYRDDGAGLDPAKLAESAVAKGLITAEQAASLKDNETISLIFQPGFSTASSADQHAGRGVGMDIIRNHIVKQLGGKLRMSYKTGQYLELSWYYPVAKNSPSVPAPQMAQA